MKTAYSCGAVTLATDWHASSCSGVVVSESKDAKLVDQLNGMEGITPDCQKEQGLVEEQKEET